MSLGPFPASTPVTPKGPERLARSVHPPAKSSVGAVGRRGHAFGRGDTSPARAAQAPRFAHVLSLVQEQGGPTHTAEARESRARDVSGGCEEPHQDSDIGDGSAAPASSPVDTPTAAPVQTPWLLLALGNGAQSRTNDEVSTAADCPIADCMIPEGGLTDPVQTGAGESAVATPDAPPGHAAVRPGGGPPLETPIGSGGTEHAGLTEMVDDSPSSASSASSGSLVSPARGSSVENAEELTARTPVAALAPDADNTPSTADAPSARRGSTFGDTAEPSPVAGASPDTRSPSPAAEMLARWHAAARRSGGDVPAPRPSVAQSNMERVAATLAPGQTISQLARAVGAASRQEHTRTAALAAEPVGVTTDGQWQAAAGGLPSARAAEVLMRLANDGAPSPRAHDPAMQGTAVGQVSAAALGEWPSSRTSASSPRTAPAPLSPEAGEQVLQHLVSSLKMQWKDGVGEAKVHLRPDALGSVTVSLRVEGGAVTAVVRAESSQVQEWVLQHQQTLRQQMEAAGLRLDELVVSPDDQRQPNREESSPDPQRRRPRATTQEDDEADAPRFQLLA